MSEEKKEEKSIGVEVVIAPRPDFTGYYRAGEFWPNGASRRLVTETQAKMLEDDSDRKRIGFRRLSKGEKLDDAPSDLKVSKVSAEEKEFLEHALMSFRARKAKEDETLNVDSRGVMVPPPAPVPGQEPSTGAPTNESRSESSPATHQTAKKK